jgi:hypothetical protein
MDVRGKRFVRGGDLGFAARGVKKNAAKFRRLTKDPFGADSSARPATVEILVL